MCFFLKHSIFLGGHVNFQRDNWEKKTGPLIGSFCWPFGLEVDWRTRMRSNDLEFVDCYGESVATLKKTNN